MPRGIKKETMDLFQAKFKEAIGQNRFSYGEFIAGEAEIPQEMKRLMRARKKTWELFIQGIATETHKITASKSIFTKNYEGYVKSIEKFIVTGEFKGMFLIESKIIFFQNCS